MKNRKLIKYINDDFKIYMQYCSEEIGQEEQVAETKITVVKSSSDPAYDAALPESGNSFLVVDFGREESMAFTKPRSIMFWGKELPTPSTWKDVYASIVSVLYERYPDVFSSINSFPGSTRLEFDKADDASHMTSPREISEDLCVETNFSATDFIKRIKALLNVCGVAYDELKIVYERRTGTTFKNSSVSAPTSSACEAKFLAYLQNTAKLAVRTCSAYVSSIRSAERYAADKGYVHNRRRKTHYAYQTASVYGKTLESD
ncbi:MAG: hypothetical protein ACI4DP_06810 [Candidatus Ornithomonoglobus sp.]